MRDYYIYKETANMIMYSYCIYENVCKKNMVNIIWCISEHASDIPSSIGPRCLLSVCEHGLGYHDKFHTNQYWAEVSTFCVCPWTRCLSEDGMTCIIIMGIWPRCLLSGCAHDLVAYLRVSRQVLYQTISSRGVDLLCVHMV